MAIYLDCAATTPLDPRVQEEVFAFLAVEFGNAGSRTHAYGERARSAVERARNQVAALVGAARSEVVFTSGATESNNLAILGLAEYGRQTGKTHLVSTEIEHPAVLEPLRALEARGFTLTLVPPERSGRVAVESVLAAVRESTLLISVMQLNNETGIRQPIAELAEALAGHPAYFHVDAAQGYGKESDVLRSPRIDLMSISGHKLYAPKGVGALITRRRGQERVPLTPLMFGGGQELGLRPGTLPVALIVGLGKASELALQEEAERAAQCQRFRERLLQALQPLEPILHGDQAHAAPQILNLSFPGLLGEDVVECLREQVALSHGAACSSQSRTCSPVLTAMGLPEAQLEGAVRLSWCHMTPEPNTDSLVRALERARKDYC
ncbi:aminotransferase class V-fold PLP-dependent enzyme [Armatimonas rosea]|uniref:cysteine desulfurase n=1 Tax=Armatimonas rosea TaxID=685828 RepID=A0A7W9SKY3_ARMRO|nr:aminotransferase class V-fold PLP-dependent enzyme [Armatimonas rosea]MBB6048547.1 cysteine desulfurase [Armatimonas rosea]